MREFSEERDWKKFHDPKSLILALVGEVGEPAELFRWVPAEEAAWAAEPGHRARVGEEIADVLLYPAAARGRAQDRRDGSGAGEAGCGARQIPHRWLPRCSAKKGVGRRSPAGPAPRNWVTAWLALSAVPPSAGAWVQEGDPMPIQHTAPDPMSPYERQAWDQLLAQARKRDERQLKGVPAQIRQVAQRAGQSVSTGWDALPGSDQIEAALASALRGIQRVTLDSAMRTVNESRVIASYQKQFPEVTTLADLRRLELRECDLRIPKRRTGYGLASIAAGASSSLLITGTVVATTVSGGVTAAVTVGALAADVAGTLAGLGRIVAVTAAQYGYDVREPEEEIYALGVLSYSMAASGTNKVAALTSLSRLTQEMMRGPAWAQLRKHQLVRIIDRIYATLGLQLTKKKLAQAVPIAGAIINGGLNAELVDRTFRRASQAYRLRFLAEKHGLDLTAALASIALKDDDGEEPEVPAIDEMIEEALAEPLPADDDEAPDG